MAPYRYAKPPFSYSYQDMLDIQQPILSVTELNRQVKNYLEIELGLVHVEGEISNLSKPSSGHFYFTLKDKNAQIRCVFFKNRHYQNSLFQLNDGQHLVATGRLSLYEARGDYQLIVEQVAEAGLGALYQRFEALKKKLELEGLFHSSRKKSIPPIPQCIGIITSPTGAAIRDILSTLSRRYPLAPVVIYPSEVQGVNSSSQLIKALLRANHEARCDVLVLARGGGSMEDLWAFNEEALARAIVESTIPIVSGIGHETDFTIADFVADYRAETPTAAATAVTPDKYELLKLFAQTERRLQEAMHRTFQKHHLHLHYCSKQLHAQHPRAQIQNTQMRLNQLHNQLLQQLKGKIERLKQHMHTHFATLHAVSPLATLDRGYAIASKDQHVLNSATEVKVKDKIQVRLAKGQLLCDVLAIEAELLNTET